MAQSANEISKVVAEATARAIPSDEERQRIYDAEIVRRFRAGETLTATDKRED